MRDYILANVGPWRPADGWTVEQLNNLSGNIKTLDLTLSRYKRGFKERLNNYGDDYGLIFENDKRIVTKTESNILTHYFDYSKDKKSLVEIRNTVQEKNEFGPHGEILSWFDYGESGSQCTHHDDGSIVFESKQSITTLRDDLTRIESKDGRLITEHVFDGTRTITTNRTGGDLESQYTFDGPLKLETLHFKNNEASSGWRFEYDDQRRLIHTSFMSNARVGFKPSRSYEYDRHENPLLDYESSKESAHTIHENTLTEHGDIASRIGTRKHTGKVIYRETNDYQYDDAGNWIEKKNTVIAQGQQSQYRIYKREFTYF